MKLLIASLIFLFGTWLLAQPVITTTPTLKLIKTEWTTNYTNLQRRNFVPSTNSFFQWLELTNVPCACSKSDYIGDGTNVIFVVHTQKLIEWKQDKTNGWYKMNIDNVDYKEGTWITDK